MMAARRPLFFLLLVFLAVLLQAAPAFSVPQTLLFDAASPVTAYPPPLPPSGEEDSDSSTGPTNAIDQDQATVYANLRKQGAGIIVGPLAVASSPSFLVITAR